MTTAFYGSHAISRWGTFGAAFGAGGRAIFGPFSFAESWSSDDFESNNQFTQWVKPYLSQVNRKDLSWDPPTPAVLSRAGANWSLWKSAADAEAAAGGAADATNYIASITSQMNDLISRADAFSVDDLTDGSGHRSESVEVSRYDVFNQIKAIVNKVAASAATATTALNNANLLMNTSQLPASTIPPTGAATYPSTTSPAYYSPSTGASSQASTAAGAGSDNTLLYIGLGVGAVALLGGGLFVFRKKKAAVAGYRRRHRKSRRRS